MPRLVTDRKTMDEVKKTFADKGRGRSTANSYGICYNEEKIIYVNTNSRLIRKRIYSHVKYSQRQRRAHRATYSDYLHTLVHELVHYRFKYLNHGAKYEKRIREILSGKVFSDKSLYNGNMTPTRNKYVAVTGIVTNTENPTPISKAEPTPEESSKLFGDNNTPKPKNIAEFTGIIDVNEDGFLEVNSNSQTSITELLKCLCRKEVKFRIEEIY